MPAPAKTGRDQILAAGRELLEEGGADAVTMHAVAERVGVRAPSLYKHLRDRRDLLTQVVAAAMDDITARVGAVRDDTDPRRSIVQQLRGLRRFAHESPHAYGLVFGSVPGAPHAETAALERSLVPLLDATTALLGPEHALDGARFVMAWANGFVTMELTGALRMGGDIDAAWEWGLQRAVDVVASS
jgi:AcrR family transcriptional regulator